MTASHLCPSAPAACNNAASPRRSTSFKLRFAEACPQNCSCCAAQAEELQALDSLPPGLRLEAEFGSQFLFLCERPARLVVPQPIRGQHKVWALPGATARQFAPALKRAPQVRAACMHSSSAA
jgi:hypothetical protein